MQLGGLRVATIERQCMVLAHNANSLCNHTGQVVQVNHPTSTIVSGNNRRVVHGAG
jgi:hypothetical protein